MPREIGQDRAALIDTGIGINSVDDLLRSGLVHARVEIELSATHRSYRGGTIVQPVIRLANFVTSSWV
jgi:hypothetical protein